MTSCSYNLLLIRTIIILSIIGNGSYNSIIIGCHDGIIRKIDLFTGSIIWQSVDLDIILFSTPFIYTNICVICDTSGNIVIIDVNTGKVYMKYLLTAEIYSSPIIYNDKLYIGCRDDMLHCLSLHT